MIGFVILLLCSGISVCLSQCEDPKGLEHGDTFYNFTSTHSGDVNRVLRGTKNTVRMAVGESVAYTVSGKIVGSDFNMSKLCLWTANASYFLVTFEGPFQAPQREVDPSGRISVRSVGPPLSAERIRLHYPDQWTKVCVNRTGVFTRIRLQAYGYQNTQVYAKAFHMHACPRRKKAPHPTCNGRQDLVAGQTFYNVTSSHGDSNRVLMGTRQTSRAPVGKSLYFTIVPASMEGVSGLDVTMLCIWTLHATEIVTTYHGVAPEQINVYDSYGNVVGRSVVGPGLSNERNEVADPSMWSQSCMRYMSLHTQIDITINGGNLASRVMAKGLIMHACPWTRGG